MADRRHLDRRQPQVGEVDGDREHADRGVVDQRWPAFGGERRLLNLDVFTSRGRD